MLFYDRSAGYAEFHTTDGHGNVALLRAHGDWDKSWDCIVPVNHWVGGTTWLVFYSRAAGLGEVYSTDALGNLQLVRAYPGWRRTWAQIIPLRIGTGSHLLFYEQTTGHAELYLLDLQGGLHHRRSFDDWQTHWSLITPVALKSSRYTGLVCYDRAAGHAEFQTIDGEGTLLLVRQYTGFRRSWHLLLTGSWGGVFGDLLLYDREHGEAELLTLDPWPLGRLEGYVSQESVAPLQSLGIHVRSEIGPFRLEVLRRGLSDTSMRNLGIFADVQADIPIDASENGCNWPVTTTYNVPYDTDSGLYVVRITALGGGSNFEVPFIVRPDAHDRRAQQPRILFAVAASTYEAYNWWGGRSLYGHGLLGGGFGWGTVAAYQVSTRRPNLSPDDFVKPKFQFWELPCIRWLERNGIEVDYCTSYDLHDNPVLLERYQLLLCVGHDEYWSWEMRNHVERFVSNGSNAAILSGNSVWWQVRFDEPGAMTCYKDVEADPASADPATRSRVTVNWYAEPANRPEAWLTGVSYKYSGPLIYGGDGVREAPVFEVVREHPLLAHTGLTRAGCFGTYREAHGRSPWAGGIYSVVGYEGDARPLPPDRLNWRANWDLIVSADRTVASTAGILFYDRGAGEGELYDIATSGSLSLRKLHQGWRQSWDEIVCGSFGTTTHPDFLFYDRSAGVGEFYATDVGGALVLLHGYDGWRQSWDLIVPGNFAGSGHTDLLFYDRSAGVGEFYRTDGAGRLSLLQTHVGWRQSWDLIVPGRFGGSSWTDLLFYERASGTGEFYATEGNGGIELLTTHQGWRQSSGSDPESAVSGLSARRAVVLRSGCRARRVLRNRRRGWHQLARHARRLAHHLAPFVPLKLDDPGSWYLLFYEAETGFAELYSVTNTGTMGLCCTYADPAFTLIAKAMYQGEPDAGTGVVPPILEYSSLGVLRIGSGHVLRHPRRTGPSG